VQKSLYIGVTGTVSGDKNVWTENRICKRKTSWER